MKLFQIFFCQRLLEERSIELRQLDKEMEEQERKYERAQAVRTQLSKELRTSATNADFYEQVLWIFAPYYSKVL